MNKSSYYYKKLGQSILFSEKEWREIVDDNDPHDNIFSEDFLKNFSELLSMYYKKECLEETEIKNLFILLSDLRTYYPYKTRTEKANIFEQINDMIRLGNRMKGKGAFAFYLEEYQKRYGIYGNGKQNIEDFIVKYYIYCIDGDMHAIKQDLAADIYTLTLLFKRIEDLSETYIDNLLLSDLLLSTINAVSIEYPKIIQDSIIRTQFLWILRKNKELLKKNDVKSGDYINDMNFKIQNHLVLNRLQKIK